MKRTRMLAVSIVIIAVIIGLSVTLIVLKNNDEARTESDFLSQISNILEKDKYAESFVILDFMKPYRSIEITCKSEFNELDLEQKHIYIRDSYAHPIQEKLFNYMISNNLVEKLRHYSGSLPEIIIRVLCGDKNYSYGILKEYGELQYIDMIFVNDDKKEYRFANKQEQEESYEKEREIEALRSNDNNKDDTFTDKSFDNSIELYYEGIDILCGTTQDNYKELISYIVAKDDYGFSEMFLTGRAFKVPSKTHAIILERKLTTAKVRIVEGLYENEIAWVASEAVID